MELTMRIGSKEVCGYDKKETYLKGCKSVAKFCRQRYKNVNTSFSSYYKGFDPATGLHTFNFEIYTSVNFDKELSKQCERCREYHKLFFLSEERNCEVCTLNSFAKRMREALNISKEAYKEKLE